jgi:hypothetical protein
VGRKTDQHLAADRVREAVTGVLAAAAQSTVDCPPPIAYNADARTRADDTRQPDGQTVAQVGPDLVRMLLSVPDATSTSTPRT